MQNSFEQKINNNLIKYAILIIPILLISGPFLPDLVVTLSSIFCVYQIIRFKNYKLFQTKYFIIFLLFYFVCIFSSVISDFQIYSLKTSLSYLRFALFTLVFIVILKLNKDFLEKLFYVFTICYLALVFDGFFQYITGETILGHKMKNVRLSSFFGDELILGSYLSRFLPLLIGLSLLLKFNQKLKFKIFFNLLILFSVILIFLTGERASFFYVTASIIFLLITTKDLSKHFLFLGVFSAIFIIVLASFDTRIKERMLDRTLEQIGFKEKKINMFSEMHQGHYMVSYSLFKENKFFGVGPKNFRKHCFGNKKYEKKPYFCANHSHNTYMQLLSETGLAGFVIVFLIFLRIIFSILIHLKNKFFFKSIKFDDFELCLITCFLITLWPIIPTGNFFNNFINIIYFYPLAIYLSYKNKFKF